MSTTRKRGGRKYGKAAGEAVKNAMRLRKRGSLRSGRGGKVTSRKQAIAIGLSQARKRGAKVPPPPRRSTARRSTARRGGGTKK